MTEFTLHSEDSAPAESQPLLQQSQKAFGMIPGLHAVMAESPGLLEGYQRLHALFSQSSFDCLNTIASVWIKHDNCNIGNV